MKDESTILSVGIDIGTSTTQVIFSRLTFKNSAGYFAVPHIAIVDKEVVYKSGIYTTPLENRVMIDGVRVREIVAGEFQKAGYRPEDTQTGAVIITGESARKENSEIVLQELSDFAGEFVVSTAGPDLEAIIAGKGSGARQYSVEHQCRVANPPDAENPQRRVFARRGGWEGLVGDFVCEPFAQASDGFCHAAPFEAHDQLEKRAPFTQPEVVPEPLVVADAETGGALLA